MHLKLLSARWRPCCPGGDELKSWSTMLLKGCGTRCQNNNFSCSNRAHVHEILSNNIKASCGNQGIVLKMETPSYLCMIFRVVKYCKPRAWALSTGPIAFGYNSSSHMLPDGQFESYQMSALFLSQYKPDSFHFTHLDGILPFWQDTIDLINQLQKVCCVLSLKKKNPKFAYFHHLVVRLI